MNVLVIGTAGSGKSTFVSSFSTWLKSKGISAVAAVNLDPACDTIAYRAAFDVRKLFTVKGLMRKHGLGPNGATLKAMELLAKKEFPKIDGDFVLYDAPGQMEGFVFSGSGRRVAKKLSGIALFLVDCARPSVPDLLGQILLYLSVGLQLGTGSLLVFNKSDLLTLGDRKNVTAILSGDTLHIEGTISEVYEKIVPDIPRLIQQRPLFTSGRKSEGFDALLETMRESSCSCGELA